MAAFTGGVLIVVARVELRCVKPSPPPACNYRQPSLDRRSRRKSPDHHSVVLTDLSIATTNPARLPITAARAAVIGRCCGFR